MFASISDLSSDNNHGSAAVTTASLGLGQGVLNHTLPPMAAVAIQASTEHQDAKSRASLPMAASMTGAAAESLGTTSMEYFRPKDGRPWRAGSSDGRSRLRRPASAGSRCSDLGPALDAHSRSPKSSEDTLVFSPELTTHHGSPLWARRRSNRQLDLKFLRRFVIGQK